MNIKTKLTGLKDALRVFLVKRRFQNALIYLNLTNGIEYLKQFNNVRYIRIQSTACEQKRWEYILSQISDDFLLNLAIGKMIIVFDTSARKEVSRALYQGLEFIKWVIYKEWFDIDYKADVKGYNCQQYFEEQYRTIDKTIKKKYKYFRKFLLCDRINLEYICKQSGLDGNYEEYATILKMYA